MTILITKFAKSSRLTTTMTLAVAILVASCGKQLPETAAKPSAATQSAATGESAPAAPGASLPSMISPTEIAAEASSTLASTSSNSYDILNLFDNNSATAWNHDGSTGSAVGQTLTFRFPRPVELAEIRLVNGYDKDENTFLANGRVETMQIKTDDPDRIFSIALEDTATEQVIKQDFGPTQTVEIEISSVFAGSRYLDVALSSIEFWE